MASMKNLFMEKVDKALAEISNSMDGEAEVWLCQEVQDAWGLLYEAMQKLALLEAVYEECAKDYEEDLYEVCSNYDEEFEDLLTDLQKTSEAID